MLALIIIGLILAIILAILLIPVGVDLGYEQEEFHLSAKLNGFSLQLIPKPPASEDKKPRKKKPKKEKKKPQAEPEGEAQPKAKKKRRLDFSKEEIFALVKTALRGMGRFRRKLTVQRFLLHFTAAGKDPCDTAMLYGYVNAALSSLAPICAQRFTVKHSDVWTELDFCAERVRLDFGLALTIRIGQILGVGLRVGFGALKIFIRSKLRLKREAREVTKAGIPAQTEIETNTIQQEERMAANG